MSPGPDGLQESSTKYLKTNWLQNYSFFQKIEKSLYNWLYEISVILVPKVDKKKKKEYLKWSCKITQQYICKSNLAKKIINTKVQHLKSQVM